MRAASSQQFDFWPAFATLTLVVTGCGSSLDMASAYDAKREATTIPYTAVGEANRLYPDYSPIDGSILGGGEPSPSAKHPKKGAPP